MTGGTDPAGERSPVEPPALVPMEAALERAGQQIRAPWAASAAGLAFAILFTIGLVMLRSQPVLHATDVELARWFATGQDLPVVVAGLYLMPFAGIAFLWFVAVIRDQIGEREDRFFATVFFGGGILFVAMEFISTAIASAPSLGVRYLDQDPPTAAELQIFRSLAYTLLFAFATRAGAVFLFATATIGLRSRVFPRWFAISGYVLGTTLLIAVSFFEWAILVLPIWVESSASSSSAGSASGRDGTDAALSPGAPGLAQGTAAIADPARSSLVVTTMKSLSPRGQAYVMCGSFGSETRLTAWPPSVTSVAVLPGVPFWAIWYS